MTDLPAAVNEIVKRELMAALTERDDLIASGIRKVAEETAEKFAAFGSAIDAETGGFVRGVAAGLEHAAKFAEGMHCD